ncbi:ATP-binding cassette domain-containing protein [Thiomonas bhubaneswarensis]|uniref:ABC-type multidrug transport system, ATPase component n=1 Tax=Thiomonas bhubaneswarensis TaxID=339866 RepID=A0A0K6I728_9BURK|nr:ATP-binding cassette domain-containing protein [Thiomonas bhubaneswarensis]CUA98944.1 ABC-type multidrug transport system, ATPase component [Thiomonas bhubaneswarensis]
MSASTEQAVGAARGAQLPAAALELVAVHKQFKQGKRMVDALKGLDARFLPGRISGLLGPDGAGKTTLIRLAAALLEPSAGQVLVLGLDTRLHATAIQQRIGYMPQRFGLYEDLTVQENLELYADLQGLTVAARQQRFAELLKLTALGPFSARRAGALSGGMKQKLGLACTLLRAPSLLLLDEPTVGVDPISRRELWSIIKLMREQGVAVVVSTAYLDEAEQCDDIVLLHEGKVLAHQPPKAFRAPLEGRVFLVRHPQQHRRALQESLHIREGVVDALVQAEGVRVVLQSTDAPAQEGEQWLAVEPRFEDAFVSLLQSRQLAHATTAPQPSAPMAAEHAAPVQAAAATNPLTVIEVKELRRFFGSFQAVKGISFSVNKGEIFGLLGANGAGKSTTFRMLCGLLPASSGTLRVAGADLRTAGASARARIGYVAQKFALYGNLSARQNLDFFASAYGLRGARRRQRLEWAFAEFDLAEYADSGVMELPLGYKQRLALACALMHEPSILFLDEPTSGVDPLARREFWQRINHLAESGVTVMVTTHFMDEAEYCDHLVLMSLGEILAFGTPSEIRGRVRSDTLPDPTMEDAFIALIQSHEAQIRRAA